MARQTFVTICGSGMPSGVSLVGRKFGALRVLRERRCDVYVCSCSLSENTITVWRSQLTKGVLRSCGCNARRRGTTFGHVRFYQGRDGRRHQKTSSERLSYVSMRCRCLYKTTTGYEFWGGRGIKICPRWLEPRGVGFLNFLADMKKLRPVGCTLDRIDVQGHYEPGNCRWATDEKQYGNRRCILFPDGNEPPVVPLVFDTEDALACG